MVSKLLVAWGLMSLCVVIHATGMTYAFRWLRQRARMSAVHHFWLATWLFIGLAAWMVLLHLIEITTWALYYVWKDAMADLPSALYFSAVTYTTTGYGDLVLPEEWRLVGAVSAHGHSDVRVVDRLLLRGCGPHVPGGTNAVDS